MGRPGELLALSFLSVFSTSGVGVDDRYERVMSRFFIGICA